MPAGEVFSPRQREEINRAIRQAREQSSLAVSVYVGDLGADPRAQARRLHGELDDSRSRVLVAVDPGARHLEIVTGAQVGRHLDDRSCNLAAISMTSAFAAGDLAGGIVNGLRYLAEHGRVPRTLHTEAH